MISSNLDLGGCIGIRLNLQERLNCTSGAPTTPLDLEVRSKYNVSKHRRESTIEIGVNLGRLLNQGGPKVEEKELSSRK